MISQIKQFVVSELFVYLTIFRNNFPTSWKTDHSESLLSQQGFALLDAVTSRSGCTLAWGKNIHCEGIECILSQYASNLALIAPQTAPEINMLPVY